MRDNSTTETYEITGKIKGEPFSYPCIDFEEALRKFFVSRVYTGLWKINKNTQERTLVKKRGE